MALSAANSTLKSRIEAAKTSFSPAEFANKFIPDAAAIADYSDGVRRCGVCAWEVVGEECVNCGTAFEENRGK